MKNQLIDAVEQGNQKLVQEILLDKNVDVNFVDIEEGYTAAIMAAMKNNIIILKILIDAGADLSIRSRNKLSALDWATANDNAYMITMINDQSDKSKLTKRF